jgi:elongation factor G
VDDGTTVTDFDEEEIARKHTLSASLGFAEWNRHKINLIDAPGIGNFLSEARAALQVADAALIVVDAVAGVMVQTEKVWEAAAELELPRMIVLNRIDRERASLARALASLRESCSRAVIPVQLPIGEEKSFRGVVDLVTRKAYTFQTDESGKFAEGPVPGDMSGEVETAREALIEMVAEADEKLMERFFEAGTLTDQELIAGLRSATAAAKLFPLVCTSALLNIAIQPLLDAIVSYLPSPAEREYRGVGKAGADVLRKADEKGPAAAFVWKTIADPFAGRITMFRVVSGTLKADSTVHNKTRDTSERFGHLLAMQGKTQTTVPELKAGDLGAVAKLKDTLTNDTLGDKGDDVVFPAMKFPEPVLSYAIEPKSRGDEDKISTAMHRLEEEDPQSATAAIRRPRSFCSGQGQVHIEVTVAKLKRRFGVDVNLKPPRSRTARRSRLRPRLTAATRSRRAATASSAIARSKSNRSRAARTSSSWTIFSADPFRASSCRQWKRASRTRGRAATWRAFRWSTSAPRCSTVRITTSIRMSSRSSWQAPSPSRTP